MGPGDLDVCHAIWATWRRAGGNADGSHRWFGKFSMTLGQELSWPLTNGIKEPAGPVPLPYQRSSLVADGGEIYKVNMESNYHNSMVSQCV